jgi:glycerol-3-phosphate dehydrogenase
LIQRYPMLPHTLLASLARRHGGLASDVIGNARTETDLGEHFGGQLFAREVEHFIQNEWAMSADDVLWRRTKSGLHLAPSEQQALARFIAQRADTAMR